MSFRLCTTCAGPLDLPDDHNRCVYCLGCTHPEAAIEEPECPHCNSVLMSVRTLHRGIALVLGEATTSGPPSFLTAVPPEPRRKKQQPHVPDTSVVGSELMLAQRPRSPALQITALRWITQSPGSALCRVQVILSPLGPPRRLATISCSWQCLSQWIEPAHSQPQPEPSVHGDCTCQGTQIYRLFNPGTGLFPWI